MALSILSKETRLTVTLYLSCETFFNLSLFFTILGGNFLGISCACLQIWAGLTGVSTRSHKLKHCNARRARMAAQLVPSRRDISLCLLKGVGLTQNRETNWSTLWLFMTIPVSMTSDPKTWYNRRWKTRKWQECESSNMLSCKRSEVTDSRCQMTSDPKLCYNIQRCDATEGGWWMIFMMFWLCCSAAFRRGDVKASVD